MKFECGDLERALAVSDLMPEAREHLKHCAACRREYRVWTEISAAAKELHEDWESPTLWPKIHKALEAEPKPKPAPVWWKEWKTWAIAAAVIIGLSVLAFRVWQPNPATPETSQIVPNPGNRGFLTEQALAEVERNESAYRKSIQRLSQLAQPELAKTNSAVGVNCKEKLMVLDSAIAETRANLDHNRFNVRLQTELADLYREKQQTLKELLTHAQKKN